MLGLIQLIHVSAGIFIFAVLMILLIFDPLVSIGRRRRGRMPFKPQIGKIRQFLGKLTGQLPADFHYD
jgi:hypothetical protein